LTFHVAWKRFRNVDRAMIIAYSPNKVDFIKPQRILSALYTPKLIKLEAHEFNFLDKMKDGLALLDALEYEYQYKVYFGFEKYNRLLKLFCKD
jgi:hypothetical protein